MALCVECAGICADEIFINQLTQKHRALSSGCSGRALRSSGATEAHRSDRARTKTRSKPPIRGLRRLVGEPDSPVLRRRQTPDSTNSDSRPSEPARLASSWPTRKAVRASRGPVGHQRRTQAILSPDVVMVVALCEVSASCCAVTEATWSEENDRQRFPRFKSGSLALSCVNSLLLTLAEVAVAVPPFVFGGPRGPL